MTSQERATWCRRINAASGADAEALAEQFAARVRALAGAERPAPSPPAPAAQPSRGTVRRPIERTEDSRGRATYTREKLAWLHQVARDPDARYGLPLAVALALDYLNSDTGQCNPGDDIAAADLCTIPRTIIRWRQCLIDAGHLDFRRLKAGRRRNETGHYTLIIAPDDI